MIQGLIHKPRGPLLEELAQIRSPLKQETRVFKVIDDIRGIIRRHYLDAEKVVYLENRLAHYESLDKQELRLISRGIKDELREGLTQHPIYRPDTLNEVFIALCGMLVSHINSRDLSDIVDYREDTPIYADSMNAEIIKIVGWLNIYDQLCTWVTNNQRSIQDLTKTEEDSASIEFRNLKRDTHQFITSLRSLLRQNYNIESAYNSFAENGNWDNYKSVRKVMEATLIDCSTIASNGDSRIKDKTVNDIIIRFANAIYLNAEYYFLQMGYEMLTNEKAASTIPNLKEFRDELVRTAFDTGKITYFSVIPNGGINLDGSIKMLSPEAREFYIASKPKQ